MLPALLLSIMGLLQVRWLGIANALWLATIPVLLGCLFHRNSPLRLHVAEYPVIIAFLCVIFFAYPRLAFLDFFANWGNPTPVGPEEAFGIYIRDLSHALRRANPDRNLVVVSGPTTTTYMMFYGGMRGIGTLYWENVPGLKSTAEIYAAESSEKAMELLKKHEVTHIAIFKSDAFAFHTRVYCGACRSVRNPPMLLFLR